MKHLNRILLFSGLLAVLVAPAVADEMAYIDYLGYAWETGGFPPSEPGDVLEFVGITSNIDPFFGIDLGEFELTFHLHGLSNCQVDTLPAFIQYTYCEGYLDVYMDPQMDADYGIDPPNMTSPNSFTNGILFLHAGFLDGFKLYMTSTGSGFFDATLEGIEGWVLNNPCPPGNPCIFTWGGAFTNIPGEPPLAQIPAGYDIQMDGVLEVDQVISNESSTWSGVKALYR